MASRILKLTLIVAFLGVVVCGPLSAGTILRVRPAAALDGTNYGLKIRFDTSLGVISDKAYVLDRSPDDESTYSMIFHVNPFTAVGKLTPNGRIDVAKAVSSVNKGIVVFGIRKALNGKPKFNCRIRQATGTGYRGFAGPLPVGDNRVEVYWTSASAPGAGDGTVRVVINGVEKHSVSNLTGFYTVDKTQLGSTGGNRKSLLTSGAYFLDEFSSFRTLAP